MILSIRRIRRVIFSCGTGENFNCILFSWGFDICNIPSLMVEILTLWSPHKLLKNLGALSEYAKCSQSSTKIIKKQKNWNPYSPSWRQWNGQKTISRYRSFKHVYLFNPIIHLSGERFKYCTLLLLHLFFYIFRSKTNMSNMFSLLAWFLFLRKYKLFTQDKSFSEPNRLLQDGSETDRSFFVFFLFYNLSITV